MVPVPRNPIGQWVLVKSASLGRVYAPPRCISRVSTSFVYFKNSGGKEGYVRMTSVLMWFTSLANATEVFTAEKELSHQLDDGISSLRKTYSAHMGSVISKIVLRQSKNNGLQLDMFAV